MLKIRRMNPNPDEWRASQGECQTTIPREAHDTAPTSARAPDQRLRSDVGALTEGLHPVQSRGVEKPQLADCGFGLGAEQPGRGDKANHLPRQEREILQTPPCSS